MKKITATLAAAFLILAGAAMLFRGLLRPVTLIVDGQERVINTRALTVAAALREAGVPYTLADRLTPAPGSWLGFGARVQLEHARPVTIWIDPASVRIDLTSSERIPANLLNLPGLMLFPGDEVLWNGLPVDPYQPLPAAADYTLQLRQAQPVEITLGGERRTVYSAAANLIQALWQTGIAPGSHDRLSLPETTLLTGKLNVDIQQALPLTVVVDGRELHLRTSAVTVGQALADAGVALQGLDYAVPAENQALPADGVVRVARVREEVTLLETTIPYTNETVADPETELDQTRIIRAGEYGLKVQRVRVRLENGVETGRRTEAEWVAREPTPQVTGYGTKVVLRTLDTPGGPVQYWRAVTVYATSYSPCNSGSRCYEYTASGAKVQHGVIGVIRSWYNLMLGQRLYVPGYGTGVISDIGAGVPGQNWIDLGYSDADYVPWHSTITVYFLTPVPETIPWPLP